MTLLGSQQPPPRRREPIVFVLALGSILVVAVGALFYAYLRMSAPQTATRPTPPPRPRVSAPAPPPATARPEPSARPTPQARPSRAPTATARAPRLRVESDVPGASVFVDRRFVGKAPVDVADVTPGTHRVNVSAEGYEMQVEDVDLRDEPIVVSARFKEVRLNETVEVVHKHGVGSCRGNLRATLQGLVFEADKDAFQAPLADLQRFEVDYLKKNLRVSLRGGRTYNFTTDAPNADPLLAFQQRVSAARSRLAR